MTVGSRATETEAMTPPAAHCGYRGANGRIRTDDKRFTKPLLCLLSYIGVVLTGGFEPPTHGSSDRCSTPELRQHGTDSRSRTYNL